MHLHMIRSEKIRSGKYTARIVDVDIKLNVRFGKYIADVFKPLYQIKEYKVRDNGVFHYKRKPGFLYEAKKNWNYYKFLESMGMSRQETLYPPMDKLVGKIVSLEVYEKSFTNEFNSYVKYPVGRVIKVVESPF